MKISGSRFLIITILILLIPIYANWKLIVYGEKTEGIVIKIVEENTGMLLSFYSVIAYEANQKQFTLKGPENVEYPIGKKFQILHLQEDPQNAIIFSIKGFYLNKFTSTSFVLFVLWIAFYLSFSPKSANRDSGKQKMNSNKKNCRKKLV
ncbi:hypothetical protein [Labilibaculum euxinus]|uniref:DUF3592 domain-containing protein n=1 Tax=Labilibaculum euxinus TaxID=2686357 RepID=A0A7M4D6K6_9BACT|nr:hypothetical protein [Labilibaculum euxinus]MUP38285.1 hypothetical protein [Labilibaculum euxinus]MVB07490.1 hypothetical protein [Labilibaculum euxinus]